jgi:hypothetical protein
MGQGMRFFVTIIFFTVSLMVVAGQHFATQGYGGRSTMNKPAGTIHKDVPRIDTTTPSTVKTATFALG